MIKERRGFAKKETAHSASLSQLESSDV